MRFHLGADIRQEEGEKLGEVRGLLFDPNTREVQALTIERVGLGGGEVLLPLEAVDSEDGDTIYVALSHEQFDELEEVRDENVAPPPVREEGADEQVQEPVDVPDEPPVGAATGIESIAYTPIIEESRPMPGPDQLIDRQTTVWATDGEIGRLVEVEIDDQTKRVTGFGIEKGAIFPHDIDVPAEWIADIQPETIVLKVDRATVRSAARPNG